MKEYFITGTDTGVGKTLVSAILTSVLNAQYWKPIQSGIADEPSEQVILQQLIDVSPDKLLQSVYSLDASLSPDQAARLQGIGIDFHQIIKPSVNNSIIVEGAGGVCVPINNNYTMLDVMEKLDMPVIVVTRGGLGTINHTLLTLEALRRCDLTIEGIVFSGDLNPDNQIAIETWGKVKTLFHVPYFHELNKNTLKHWLQQNKELIRQQLI